ncbi:hypothetical protein ABZ545_30500 [Streptomyces abikoensis]|uniref:Uncharacterized protein n=1 Tax=Streptomyces abikoensis TaxID=97398 RepID=A0ABW7THB6_9ACTN
MSTDQPEFPESDEEDTPDNDQPEDKKQPKTRMRDMTPYTEDVITLDE